MKTQAITTVTGNDAKDTRREIIVLIHPEGFGLDWQETDEPLESSHIRVQQDFFENWREDPYKALFCLGFTGLSAPVSDSLHFLYTTASIFVKALSKKPDIEFLREKTVVEPDPGEIESIINNAPFMNGAEYMDNQWVMQVWQKLNDLFTDRISHYQGSVAEFFASLNPSVHTMGRIFFHLVESKKDDYPFAFMATYSSMVSNEGKTRHLPLKNALAEYKNDNKKLLELLSTVNKASQKSDFIYGMVDSGEIFHPIGLMASEAYTFLKEIPIYEEAGILCRIPNWWKSKANSLRLSVKIGTKPPSLLGFDALVDFNAQISMGDDQLTIAELKKLLSETEGLAFIKGKWVEVSHEKLKETLLAYEQAQKLMGGNDMTLLEAMRFQLSPAEILNLKDKAGEIEITNGQWLNTVVSRLTHPESMETVCAGKDFHADLRSYQERGLAWLHFMKSLGLGACLADDMGLGKTIQVIALLNYIRSVKKEKALLVIPASLIGNWMNEIARFAPSLKYYVLHPSENSGADLEEAEITEEYELFITTYGMLLRYDWLKEISWNTLILDEAQAIKNPETRQTKAAKQLKADYRIAMTGTPVGNRLSDLWSLFDFLNKGLLGSPKEFTDFTRKLKENQSDYSRLKKVVSPFILRRLKTDKTIIADLPEKIEMKTYSVLTKKQAALYDSLVEEIKSRLESSEDGIERKGLILSSIMKFKQICNHPDQYLGQAFYTENESGKYARLREICETIYEKRERVLVFTQFKEITQPLKEFLQSVFHHQGLVLHGETPVAKRREVVENFQGPMYVPFLVLSIKAGGVGLNLTSANHVIHFDRWWNPAVENQATDRAFRIGQKKNVLVHKFITQGTIEEKIDRMIEEKTKLSKDIIPDIQESWITEMDNRQLMDLFRLER